MFTKVKFTKNPAFAFALISYKHKTSAKRSPRCVSTFTITMVLIGAWSALTAPEVQSQVQSLRTDKEVIQLCNRHTRQSATSASFDLGILGRLAAKLEISKSKLIEVSDSVFFLIGQEESDCRLLLSGIINKEDYRASQEKRLEVLAGLQKYRENAEKAAEERISAKPANADPSKLLEELNKKLPPPSGNVVKRPASFLRASSVGEQLDEVIDRARKSRIRNF
jgi:hypothetical protein